MNKNKLKDILVVSAIIIFADVLWLSLDLKPLTGGLLFTILPVIYMGIKRQKNWRNITSASIVLGLLLGAAFDLIQSFNASWIVDRLVVPWKIFGVLPVDNIIGYFIMTLLVLVFYEHFLRQSITIDLPKRFYKVSVIVFLLTVAIFALFAITPEIFAIRFAYLLGGIVASVIVLYALWKRPYFLNNSLRLAAYFFFVWFAAEIVALKTSGWTFAGEYIGWVSVFGVYFPFEEMFFWMFWYAPFLLLTYEYLLRPGKKAPLTGE
jgi:hypothetical protein